MKKKINLIDVLILIVVIVFAAGVYMRFASPATEKVVTNNSYEMVVKVSNVRSYTVDALKKSKEIFFKDTTLIGEVVSVEEGPYIAPLKKLNGEFIKAEVPEKYECIVTLKMNLKESDTSYFAGNDLELRVGSGFDIESKYVSTSGAIISIDKID